MKGIGSDSTHTPNGGVPPPQCKQPAWREDMEVGRFGVGLAQVGSGRNSTRVGCWLLCLGKKLTVTTSITVARALLAAGACSPPMVGPVRPVWVG